jgi:Fe-Mn family superoxide dismutase
LRWQALRGFDATILRRGVIITSPVRVRAPAASSQQRDTTVSQAITLPPLPYADNALDPVISANTLGFHYGKHHKAYVDNLNRLIAGTPLEGQPLESIILESAGKADQAGVFNNSAQIWNHTFYWNSLKPNGGGTPPAQLAKLIERDFGSLDALKKELATAATTQFGSGWAWLASDNGKLVVTKTSNAELPMTGASRRC